MVVDPITRELINKALITIADNMVVTVMRTARSHVVKQSLDFSTAVCDADGQLVAQGLSLPVHLGAIMPALEGVLRYYRGDVQPGDVFINNDPYEGGQPPAGHISFQAGVLRRRSAGLPGRHRPSDGHRGTGCRGQCLRPAPRSSRRGCGFRR
jgi:hypothetical protein